MDKDIQCLIRALSAARGRLVLTGHDAPDVDSVVSCVLMRELLEALGFACVIVLPTAADEQAERVMAHFGVDVTALRGKITQTDSLVLLDHHRALHPGTVAACVDHHPTLYPPHYPFVLLSSCGACALLVLRLMMRAGLTPTKEQSALAVTALYLDTMALRSAKIAPDEAAWGREQAQTLALDTAWLEREGLNLQNLSLPLYTLAQCGRKDYDFAGQHVVSSYIQTNEMTEPLLDRLLTVLRAELTQSGACLWVFLLHDPVAMCSARYDLMLDGRMVKTQYDHLISRGSTVMPQVERMLREGGASHA